MTNEHNTPSETPIYDGLAQEWAEVFGIPAEGITVNPSRVDFDYSYTLCAENTSVRDSAELTIEVLAVRPVKIRNLGHGRFKIRNPNEDRDMFRWNFDQPTDEQSAPRDTDRQ